MASTMRLEIVTPEGTAFSADVELVTIPTIDGQIGVLPHHVDLMTCMIPGEMLMRRGGHDQFIAVGAGLVEVTGTQVSIATDMAVAAANIDEAKAEEARQRATMRLREKLSSEEIASINASIARSLAQLRVKKRHRV